MNREQPRRRLGLVVANGLTAIRLLVAAPLMVLLAIAGNGTAFLWVLGISFCTDAVDGFVARWTGGTSRFGAMLDSWADVAAYSAVAIGVVLLWPSVVAREWLAVGAIVLSFIVPSAVGLRKFGRFTSYHTLLVKVAVASVAAGLYLMLLGGPAWPFRLAALVAVLAALEEIAITAALDAPRSNVRGLRAVLRDRK